MPRQSSAGQHDAAAVVFLHVRQGAQALLLHVVLEDLVLGVGGLDGLLRLLAGHVRPRELLHDAFDHQLVVGQVEVRPHVADALFAQFGHIGADDHRIVGHHRAVVVVVGVVDQVLLVAHARVEDRLQDALFAQFGHIGADDHRIVGHHRAVVVVVGVVDQVLLVAHARVEDRLHALAEQPLDVAVHQLGRVADVLGGDRLDARLEQFVLLVAHARVEDRLHALAEQPLDVAVHQLGRVADVLGGDRLDARLEQFMAGTPGDHDLEPEITTLKPSEVSSVNQNG